MPFIGNISTARVLKTKYGVKNRDELIERIRENLQELTNNEIRVSFDVKALFLRSSVMEALVCLEEDLLEKEDSAVQKRGLGKYIKLASLCISETYFTFRDRFYKITSGVAMGNPLPPQLSEIFIKKN